MSDDSAPEPEPTSPKRGPRWVTDGGLESYLIHRHGLELPLRAAFPLLSTSRGRAMLAEYYSEYADVARRAGAGLLLETPTWRANPDWVTSLGGGPDDVRRINLDAVVFVAGLIDGFVSSGRAVEGGMRVAGVVGPRRVGDVPGMLVTAGAYAEYHARQISAFAETGTERVTAYTIGTVTEAAGIVEAARGHGLDVGVSFTVDASGRLPDGTPLGEAVSALWAQAPPDDLLVNCAHPRDIAAALGESGPDGAGVEAPATDSTARWAQRVTGLRVRASRRSGAESPAPSDALDEAGLIDLVAAHRRLESRLPRLDVVGGGCGTDVRHVAALWGVA